VSAGGAAGVSAAGAAGVFAGGAAGVSAAGGMAGVGTGVPAGWQAAASMDRTISTANIGNIFFMFFILLNNRYFMNTFGFLFMGPLDKLFVDGLFIDSLLLTFPFNPRNSQFCSWQIRGLT
jgi:hypothetical protein